MRRQRMDHRLRALPAAATDCRRARRRQPSASEVLRRLRGRSLRRASATEAVTSLRPIFFLMNEQRPRIKGTTEEIGEIVPPIDRRVAEDGDDDDAGDDAIIEIDDGEEIGKKDPSPRR